MSIEHYLDWHETGEHEFRLLGHGRTPLRPDAAARLTLTAISVLATPDSMYAPRAVCFTASVFLPTSRSHAGLNHSQCVGCYGSLWNFRDQLVSLRQGQARSASLDGAEGFELELIEHDRLGLCVSGCFFDPIYMRNSRPTVAIELTDMMAAIDIIESSNAHSLSFAFTTSLVDPPWLDHFICQLNEFLSFLESFE
jgi:hypothetical protein